MSPVSAMGKETGSGDKAKRFPSASSLLPPPHFACLASSSSATCCHPWTHVRYGASPHPGGGGDQGNPVVQDHCFESSRLGEPIICNPGREVGAGWMSLQKATVSAGCTTAQWHLLQRHFLLSAGPISQMGKSRQKQRTYLGDIEAQASTTPPCPT